MPRSPRIAPAGYVYHVINRGFLQSEIFADEEDYNSFIDILANGRERYDMRICSYCLMPNHWHLALWPKHDNSLSPFMQYVSSLHVIAWRKRWGSSGHLYQGRFRSFPVQTEGYYLNLIRYIEQNPKRAKPEIKCTEWQWSSARHRPLADNESLLSEGPVRLPQNWLQVLEILPSNCELADIRTSIEKGKPLGDASWTEETALELNLLSTLRKGGRPQSK